ncbi:hypothetical protein ABIE64_003621, partial [Thalassospira sp. MBR-102]
GIIPSAHSSQLSNTSKRKTPPKYDGVCQRSDGSCIARPVFLSILFKIPRLDATLPSPCHFLARILVSNSFCPCQANEEKPFEKAGF